MDHESRVTRQHLPAGSSYFTCASVPLIDET